MAKKGVPVNDLTGKQYGCLTVIKYVGDWKWLCRCNFCGDEKLISTGDLNFGHRNSCRCQRNKNMPPKKPKEDLTGKKFSYLTVEEWIGHGKGWRCKCDCGNERFVSTGNLKSGGVKSCGECKYAKLLRGNGNSQKSHPKEDLTGQTFNYLTVEEYSGNGEYKCRCVCGNIRYASKYNLQHGKIKSCGCMKISKRNTKPKNDLTGRRFGKLVAQYWEKDKGWYCHCDCGNEKFVLASRLVRGHTTSCGCRNFETKNLKDLTNFENEYIKVLNRVENSESGNTRYKCLCKNCGQEFITYASYIKDILSCGCIRSRNETLIAQLFTEMGIDFKRQYTFKDLYYKSKNNPLRFDFAVFKDGKLSHLIEYNGAQHYEACGKWGENLEELQIRDNLKIEYCRSHNIELRIIKYDQNYDINDLI